jgi:hypothetical protein
MYVVKLKSFGRYSETLLQMLRRVAQVQGSHEQVFVRGVEVRLRGPGNPQRGRFSFFTPNLNPTVPEAAMKSVAGKTGLSRIPEAAVHDEVQQPVVKVQIVEKLPSGAKAQRLFCAICGTTKVVPCYKTDFNHRLLIRKHRISSSVIS